MLFAAAPARRLRGRRLRRGRLLAGQVRHPHRAPAAAAARRRQRLDRGHHRRLDHPRRAARRRAHQPEGVDDAARLRHADDRHRHRHARPRPRSPSSRSLYVDRRDLQLVHPRHRRRPPGAEQEPVLPDPRVLALRRRCCGATSSARSRSRRRRCSGAPAPRCSSSCSTWAGERARLRPVAGVVLQGVVAVGHRGRRRARGDATCRCGRRVNVLPVGVAMGSS